MAPNINFTVRYDFYLINTNEEGIICKLCVEIETFHGLFAKI